LPLKVSAALDYSFPRDGDGGQQFRVQLLHIAEERMLHGNLRRHDT